jgi:hypothetical protein
MHISCRGAGFPTDGVALSRHNAPFLTRRRFGLALTSAAAAPAAFAAAPPSDLAGWGETRWGMTGGELAHLLGSRRAHLAAPLDYKEFVVRDTVPGLRLAGRPFVALLQLDRRTERLAQVLLRYRGDFPMLSDFVAVRDLLAKDLGPPAERRVETDDRGSIPSFWIEAGWTFPTTAVVLALVDQNADPYSGQRKTLTVRYTGR